MTQAGVAARVSLLALVFLAILPLLALGRRLRWQPAERLPVAFHRLFLRLFGVKVFVEGEPPPGDLPALILANHISWIDIPVLASLLPLSFVAKTEIAGWPIFGSLARVQRCIFLDRVRKAATAEVNAIVARRLADGDSIVLFPEGTTGDGIRLLPFRSSLVGAARAALGESGIDRIRLQPLALIYQRRAGVPVSRRSMPAIAWYGDMDLVPHFAGFRRGGGIDVLVVWGEPLLFDRDSDRKRATAHAEAAVAEAIRETRRRTLYRPVSESSKKSPSEPERPRE